MNIPSLVKPKKSLDFGTESHFADSIFMKMPIDYVFPNLNSYQKSLCRWLDIK